MRLRLTGSPCFQSSLNFHGALYLENDLDRIQRPKEGDEKGILVGTHFPASEALEGGPQESTLGD
jgi:hypothetical protein